MAPASPQPPGPPEPPAESVAFRWQAFFQHSPEPLFLLNQQRRILLVNQAWETLMAVAAADARGLVCARRTSAESTGLEPLARALCPPPEVLEGRPARVRRLVKVGSKPSPSWWDVDFFPIHDGQGRLRVLGKISVAGSADSVPAVPLPDKVAALRERLDLRYDFTSWDSSLPALRRVAGQVRLACQSRAPVLLVGETGTGKQWLARTIHHQGLDRGGDFAALDCQRLPPATLASVLFGDDGLARQPGPGTLYLREAACLPRDLQARVCAELLEENTSGRRVVAGLNAEPAEEVAAGRLLESLHCALATLVITLPPLRERQADLPVWVQRLLERASPGGAKKITGLTPAAWEMVRAYSWPGNLRELLNVLAGACGRAAGTQLDVPDLPAYVRLAVALERTPPAAPPRPLPLDHLLEQVERRLILLAMRQAQGNRSKAAELLSIWRPRLVRRLETLGLDQETSSEG